MSGDGGLSDGAGEDPGEDPCEDGPGKLGYRFAEQGSEWDEVQIVG